jgi:hypothetical protein
MLVELCARNYATHDDFVNGGDGLFQGSSKVFNAQKFIWIIFNNPKCGQLTKINNARLYEREIHPTWTPIQPVSKDIQIGSISSHIVIKHNFPFN